MKNKRRNIRKNKCSIVMVILALFAIITICSVVFNNAYAEKYYDKTKIVVSENDTLWDIAKDISKDSGDISIYKVMDDIKKLNNMTSSTIYVDQILEVYVY